MLKVLLTNDDGVISTGIQTMAKLLSYKNRLSIVIAPDRERSGMGHAMTVSRPVRIHPLDPGLFSQDVPAYSCDGTPTDCVSIGLELLFPNADFVVSGINQGPNLGDDVTYSGTVCAAMEGVILRRPSIAVSLCCGPDDSVRHNMSAAIVTMAVLDYLEETKLPEDVLLNINVPNEPIKKIGGFRLTRRGIRRYADKFTYLKDPHGKDCYWIAGRIDDEHEEGSDVSAVRDGYVSVTPIGMDMTHYGLLSEMKTSGVEERLTGVLGR